jgi:6-pyruvoyltetrahydropterin/6-carboxytetrahydropterin synthase
MRVSLTRTVAFRARHRLHRPGLSASENRAQFGWTADAPGHGHDYRCSVTVTGGPAAPPDLLIDLGALDAILDVEVRQRFDGRHLNLDVPEFADGQMLPTCEALARDLFPRIAARLPAGAVLLRVRVAEDTTLHADCTGEA